MGRKALGGFALLLALAAASLMASARPAAAETRSHVTVDPALRPGAAAIVTTWTRAGLAQVERLGVRGMRLSTLPMLLVERLSAKQLAALERSPAVRSVYANRRYELTMEDTTWIVGARRTWSELGVTGDGVEIAVIDTGADGLHEDMDNLVEFCETQQAVTGEPTKVICSPFNPASGNVGPAGATNTARGDATDDNGHGSHVSGTIAGSGDASGGMAATHSTIGVAPKAKLRVYSANVGPALATFEILAAYDDLIFKKHNKLNSVVAVSNSWGGGDGADYDPRDPIHVAVEKAYNEGILSVFAAGNSGPEHDTLSSQCVSPFVVCVAASTKPDSIVMFSSRGRPSEPADTDRDGDVDTDDVAPANHDRRLGQALGLGLYRPTLAAPGVNIFSIEANEAACREGPTPDASCYVAFNGTSMATPHVSGGVALIVEAYRQGHGGATPTSGIVTDVLERSADVSKLPAYEAEEQGAGRLNVEAAVAFARTYPNGLDVPELGHPTPPLASTTVATFTGCTGTASWTAREGINPLDPVEQPPASTARFGQHAVAVPESAERLRVTVSWPGHPSANLYLRLWRPGVDPDDETAPAGPSRVFADQESVGLVFFGDSRWLDVRAPESGTWTLRVYHRAGGAPSVCDPDSSESPKQLEGFNYDVTTEIPIATASPTAAIDKLSDAASRFVELNGSASYPTPWDGVTTTAVAGSGNPTPVPEVDTRPVLHFQGNLEEGCNGDGATDVLPPPAGCSGPFLMEKSELSGSTAASWKVADPLFNGVAARNVHDPNWVWNLSVPTTLSGPMTVEFWASCGLCDADLGIPADWRIRLWADGTKVFEQRVTATPADPNVASKLTIDVNVPPTTASSNFVLHVDPVYIDTQANTAISYDSTAPCPTSLSSEPCDSTVRVPVLVPGGAAPAAPTGVRVTDVHDGLRIAWEPVAGAVSYEVYRSTEPTFGPSKQTRVAATSATSHTDVSAQTLRTYYYRVAAVAADGTKGAASLLAYGTATRFDRQVKVKVDRLYGPQYSEYASAGNPLFTQWSYTWDTLELAAGDHPVAARSFTQGIGSAKAGPPGPSAGAADGSTAIGTSGGGGSLPSGGAEPVEEPPVGGVAGVETVKKRLVRGKGTVRKGRFVIDLRRKPGTKVLFRDLARDLRLAALTIASIRFGRNSATLVGVARVNGKRVRYRILVVDRGRGRLDTFQIRLSNGYSLRGKLVRGNVVVR